MKKVLFLIGLVGILALITAPLSAGTLYQQENTADDGTPSINAAGQGPAGDDSDNWTNWKYQYGGGTWSGVYAGSDGWLTEDETGDSSLEVEADIEMYCVETIANNKIYFHLGNIYNASNSDKIAYVTGTMTSNNGQYVGISFDGTGKTDSDFEKDGAGDYTGVILGGMQSDRDTWRTQDNSMDIQILLTWGAGWQAPVTFGAGSHGTQQNVLWWLPGGGAAGSYNFTWMVKLLPVPHQPDGDYYLDPVLVTSPVI